MFDGASYISFCGFTFENSRSAVFDGVTGDEGNILIENCIFRDLGGYAVYLEGYSVIVKDCEMYNLGSGCVKLVGGNLEGVLASGSTVENCLIHDWSQTYIVYNPAIRLDGYGFTVSHNEIFNSPHEAIGFDCGGSVIEYNYIYDVCTETGDAGAVYSGRRGDWSANIIRYNLIVGVWSSEPCAIYLDDCLSGQIIYGSITVNADSLWIGGGKKHRIFNNIFILGEDTSAISYDQRGVGIDVLHKAVTYPDGYMWTRINNADFSYLSDIQRFAVPENLLMIEQSGRSYDTRPDDPGAPSYSIICDNVIYRRFKGGEGLIRNTPADYLGSVISDIIYETDPGFVDPENGNYSLREDSRVFRDIPGFIRIDFDSIGIQK